MLPYAVRHQAGHRRSRKERGLASPVSQSLGSPVRPTPKTAQPPLQQKAPPRRAAPRHAELTGTPLCPLCGKPMRCRTAGKTQHQFWGCPASPNGKGTQDIKA